MDLACSGVCLCTNWCTLSALVFAFVIFFTVWLLWCLPVYWFVTSECSVSSCVLHRALVYYLLHSDCSGVCLSINWCNLNALTFACVLNCALCMLWCLPVCYVLHSDSSGDCRCTNWCTLNALVFACVLLGALCMLWCLLVYYVLHSDCSCVCLCTNWCTLNALACACVTFIWLWFSCVFLCASCCSLAALVSAYVLIGATLKTLVFVWVLFVTLWLRWCLHVY